MTWLCARTHPNAEKTAIRNLLNQDFDYYQPVIVEKKIRNHKRLLVQVPLFPCYLFIQVKDSYRSLHSTHGIASLVNGVVQDRVIDSLKQREINGVIQLPQPKQFQIGDKVKINNGIFAGQPALVERMRTNQRQKILLELMSNKISVLIDENDLEAA